MPASTTPATGAPSTNAGASTGWRQRETNSSAASPLSTKDLTESRALEIVRGDAVSSTRPLCRKIAEYLNDDVFAKIAAEGRKGRSLLVGTTNLDAGRAVVWGTSPASPSDALNAPALIHDVILASASIPGVFPPVLIEVEADGQRYD